MARPPAGRFFLRWGAATGVGALLAAAGALAASSGSAVSVDVLGRYPQACSKPVPRVSGTGRIAAVSGRRVVLTSPRGGPQTVLPFRLPARGSYPPVNEPAGSNPPNQLQWSRDGRFLATDDGRLWSASGKARGRLFKRLALGWSWSPASDCALGITAFKQTGIATISVGVPGRQPSPLLRGRIAAFSFTPSGHSVILVVGDGASRQHFLELNLASRRVRQLAPAPGRAPSVVLGGWAPGGRVLLFWAGAGASVLADGATLRGLDLGHPGRILTYGTRNSAAVIIPASPSITRCRGRVLAMIGPGRPYPTIVHKRLGYLRVNAPPVIVTPSSQAYVSPSCSPNASAIAAVKYRPGERSPGVARLVILGANGALRNFLSESTGFTDSAPEWRAPGILYGRTPLNQGIAELWFAAQGTGARSIGLRATAWDWSLSPPSGIA